MNGRRGLRHKVLMTSVGVIGVLLVTLILLFVQDRSSRRQALTLSAESLTRLTQDIMREHALTVVAHLADAVSNDLYYFDLESIGEQLDYAKRLPPANAAQVFDPLGHVIHDGSRELSSYGKKLDLPLVHAALASDQAQVVVTPPDTIEAAQRIRIGDQVLGGVWLRLDLRRLNSLLAAGQGELATRLEHATRSRLISLSLVVAIIALLGLAASWVIQRHIVQPILRLASAARQIEAGDYRSYRLDSGRDDEIGELERVFERMSAGVAEAHRKVERKAYVDKLTGLPNRRAFDEAIATRTGADLVPQGAFALLFIDVDNLKQINDRFGHSAGDAALIEFAERATVNVDRASAGTAWLARIGGDEFAVLCEGRPLDRVAISLADAIMRQFETAPTALSAQVALSVSVGIALYPQHAGTASDLLKCADSAMYQAKSAGKNRIHVYGPATTDTTIAAALPE